MTFRLLLPALLLLLFYGCTDDRPQEPAGDDAALSIQWGLTVNNFRQDPSGAQAFFVLDNRGTDSLTGDWEIRFSAFMNRVVEIDPAYEIAHLDGDYYALRPTASFGGLPPGESDTVRYRDAGQNLKLTMAPKGFFLLRDGEVSPLDWSQLPMTAEATFNDQPVRENGLYNDAAYLFGRYPDDTVTGPLRVVPAPREIDFLDQGIRLTKYQSHSNEAKSSDPDHPADAVGDRRLHVWYSGALWSEPMQVFKQWLQTFYGVELVIHGEEKPDGPHLELTYEKELADEAYEIFNLSEELTVVSASQPAGMLYGLATVLQALVPEDGYLTLPLASVKDHPRFAYRGQHLDVGRNFQSKASVLRLLDLMALFKLNKFHFHLSEDEGWRLEIPDLPELTTVGATRGYTTDESDRLHPAYGSGASPDDPYGSGFYSRADFVEILEYAKERQIEVIPEIDLPGHARAAIKAMEAYARRTGDDSYLLSHPGDKSNYYSIQNYPDNVIDVCQESTYKFLEKIVAEIGLMYEAAGLDLEVLHTGGDEVPSGVWAASPACLDLLADFGSTTTNTEEIKNILSAHFLSRFKDILDQREIRTAGWEEIAMRREANREGGYSYGVNTDFTDQNLLAYVWNSLGDNLDLSYELANAGYDVVVCNVTNFYFDLAYTTDPAEGGLYWGGFVDTYKPWAFAPFDMVKTVPPTWYAASPTEAELRSNTVRLEESARDNIVGIQGQLWTETVRGSDAQEHYLWPKMLGLAERAWSAAAEWETIEETEARTAVMKTDWNAFASRLGQYTLPLLDRYGEAGINYRLPPPGASTQAGKVIIRSAFPGLPVYYRIDGEEERLYAGPFSAPAAGSRLRVSQGRTVGGDRGAEVEFEVGQ